MASGARYWRTESMETDFKFYCANRHPVLQFFAYGKSYGPGKGIRAVLECNAILMAVFLEQRTEAFQMQFSQQTPHPSMQQTIFQAVFVKAFIVLFPMFWYWVQWETLVCPCQSSSAKTGHFSSCALCCKFRMSYLMRAYWIISCVSQLVLYSTTFHWYTKVTALGARSLGYLLFFAQNYVTWKTWHCCPLSVFGKWDKDKAKAEALLAGQVNSPKLRGESCRMATCKLCPIITCALAPFIMLISILASLMMYQRYHNQNDDSLHYESHWHWWLISVFAAFCLCWQACIRSAQRSERNLAAEEHLLAGQMFSTA